MRLDAPRLVCARTHVHVHAHWEEGRYRTNPQHHGVLACPSDCYTSVCKVFILLTVFPRPGFYPSDTAGILSSPHTRVHFIPHRHMCIFEAAVGHGMLLVANRGAAESADATAHSKTELGTFSSARAGVSARTHHRMTLSRAQEREWKHDCCPFGPLRQAKQALRCELNCCARASVKKRKNKKPNKKAE